jgi:hypothetical protein
MSARDDGDLTVQINKLATIAAALAAAFSGYAALRNPPLVSSDAAPVADKGKSATVKEDRGWVGALTVEHYSDGSCATVRMEGIDESIIDSCHGWELSDCDGILIIRSRGVRLDKAGTVRPAEGKKSPQIAFFDKLLDQQLGRKAGGPYEYLNLSFSEPRCTSVGATLPFQGSIIKVGGTGSADGVHGVIHIPSEGVDSAHLSFSAES